MEITGQGAFEVIKAAAYGRTAEEIAAVMGFEAAVVSQYLTEHQADVSEAANDYRKAGYME